MERNGYFMEHLRCEGYTMDLVDKNLLTELTRNCRTSYQNLSVKFGFTANAVRKRIEKLIENGTLYSFTIRPALNSMDANIALTLIETDGNESAAEFLNSLGENEMVGEVNPIATRERGYYLVLSDYIGAEGIINLGAFFRRLNHVERVTMHQVVTDQFYHGKFVEFKPLELRVMKHLIEDARMPISELAERANLTARRVRNVISKLEEDQGLIFTIRWNTAAAGAVRFFLAIDYDSKKSDYEVVVNWLQKDYQKEFWLYWISTSEPIIFASFTVDSIEEARGISIEVQENSMVKSVGTWLCYPPSKFKTFPEVWLERLLVKA
ncbi:MAG: winged helix-turn-helix transcriptional regulator [Candidatus Thorarchaeota archaeon]